MLRSRPSQAGFSLVDVLFTVAVLATIVATAIPKTTSALDEIRTASAARYLAGRIMAIRMEAVRRSTAVALRFEADGDDHRYAVFVDGNSNGVRSADVQAGTDRQLGASERLRDKFPGVRFTLPAEIRDVDGSTSGSTDGVRIGTPRILTMSPDGTATGGTLYVRGERGQYAVRVLGITGRTRVLQYDAGSRTWVSR